MLVQGANNHKGCGWSKEKAQKEPKEEKAENKPSKKSKTASAK
jgi:hypothetical protein